MEPFPQWRFEDRVDAATQLAEALGAFRGQHPLVLAIPRGGVPIGRILADRLDGELDVVLVRKLGAPGHAEFAVGAVDENGVVQLADYAAEVGADPAYLRREVAHQREVIEKRRALYSPHRRKIDPAGRIVIVVDDGLATGATMSAALSALRAQKPGKLICAIPVASPRSLASVRDLADETVCLAAPEAFRAVGQYYRQFPSVEDSEVVHLLSSPGSDETEYPAPVSIQVPIDGMQLEGELHLPAGATGLVIFAHGSGSSRLSPRNRYVAQVLQRRGLATLLFDLLSPEEDRATASRFDIEKLSGRLEAAVKWAMHQPATGVLPIGLFGASTGAAAALAVAAQLPHVIKAVVSRGGRPDLAGHAALIQVHAPTLLIVGGADTQVIALNQSALAAMSHAVELLIVPGATHLFEEPGAIEQVASLAGAWFKHWLR